MQTNSNNEIQGVLFDLDGTLADTAPDLVAALNDVLLENQLPTKPLEQLRFAASHGSLFLVKTALPDADETLQHTLQQQMLTRYHQINGSHAKLFAGMDELLDSLDAKQIPYGIVTNKHARFTRPLMAALGLTQRCQTIISGDTTKFPKPNCAPMLLAAQQLGIDPEHILYIGDAERDLAAAQNANMIGGVALWGYLNETDTPDEWPARYRFGSAQDYLALFK
ncbi:HAD-IA family hydrolase [Shewanella sp. WXL01]|uniref:HAD family hydrolase n=1 Tax=Shewanella sp. WXL01 TaxID=2709721 RepID=UPI00143829F3|nr:HAD-IA family hydrolase [Shewanella sp. WXL01]NKF50682.1 HAD-IA family hydrolase [Shewanella sp. WXL01]